MSREFLDSQFFNQPVGTKDCAFRCMWYVLSLKNIATCTYTAFHDYMKYLTLPQGGLNWITMKSMLDVNNVPYRISLPDTKGIYLIMYTTDGVKNSGHVFLYIDGVAYDSADNMPKRMRLSTLREKCSSKYKQGLNYYLYSIQIG